MIIKPGGFDKAAVQAVETILQFHNAFTVISQNIRVISAHNGNITPVVRIIPVYVPAAVIPFLLMLMNKVQHHGKL